MLACLLSGKCNLAAYRSSVGAGIASGCWLDARGDGVRVPVGEDFSPFHVFRTGIEAHPASYPIGTGCSFPGVKGLGLEADHSPATSAEVKKTWIYTSTPAYAFMA
jgi:hypothetical protein